jgi:cytochrome c-type biogenesis protein CcmH/NrfF
MHMATDRTAALMLWGSFTTLLVAAGAAVNVIATRRKLTAMQSALRTAQDRIDSMTDER